MKLKLRSVATTLFAAAVLGGTIAAPMSAEAQRDRDWRSGDSRYGDSRYGDSRYSNSGYRNSRYGNSRVSMERIRNMVNRAEDTSNEFREVFERYERDQDDYDDRDWRNDRSRRDDRGDYRYRRDDRDWHNDRGDYRYRRDDRDWRNDQYGRNSQYGRNDRYFGGRDLSTLKPYVQRIDEGLERLESQTGSSDRFNESRSTMSDILRHARVISREFTSRRSGGAQMISMWSRLRVNLNSLADIYGLQRI